MKLKNIFLATLAASSLMLGNSACSDSFLEEKMYSNFPAETDEVDAKLIGLHRIFGQFWGQADDQHFMAIFQLGTDIGMIGTANKTNYVKYGQLNADDGDASRLWKGMYKLISNANLIIGSVDEETGDKAAVAEAKFFRAYAYNMLVTLFGGVPLITEYELPRTDYVRASVEEVDKVIDEDLQYCIANLLDKGETVKESRINKDMARQLAGEAYLRMGLKHSDDTYYAKAETALSDIISNTAYQLIDTRYGVDAGEGGDYYHDMFLRGNQRYSQGNKESIWTFEVEDGNDVVGGTFDTSPQFHRVWIPQYRNCPGMVNADSIGGRGNGLIRFTNFVKYGLYEEGDIRNSNYNMRRTLYCNKSDWKDETYGVDANGWRVPRQVDDGNGNMIANPVMVREIVLKTGDRMVPAATDTLYNCDVYSTKWGFYNESDDFSYAMLKDWVMMRLGETYLLRAEARFRLGDLNGAAEDINKLRDRAFKEYRAVSGNADAGKVTADMITLDFILDERVRELITEEQRRITLVRTGTLEERLNKYTDKGSLVRSTDLVEGFDASIHTLLPIPLTEIQLNKDAVLEQNPGY